MPTTFSAATCITFNPTILSSTGPFNIYVNNDYDSDPINEFPIELALLQGTNCPYIIEVPEGTTTLGFKQEDDLYCITIPIQDNDICDNCNLGFSNYSATTVTRVSCGFLTGTCQNITSYYINWYGPDDTTTLEFSSGFGPDYISEWNIPHPFTGISSVPVIEGDYTPIIQKITINGIKYSNTGGDGYILFDGNCLQPTTIEPLTCSNRTTTATTLPYSAYSHNVFFESTSGIIPQPVNLTYVISNTTKFMAIAFCGFANNDRLTVKFKGIHYGTTEIGLEDVLVGTDISNDFNPTLFPKEANLFGPNRFYSKLICLTGLTINNNDKILITVTPNNNVTKWDLYMTCLDNYTCIDCLRTQPYKIIGSSITREILDCDRIKIGFDVSGCTRDSVFNSDYLNYYLFRETALQSSATYRNITNISNNSGIFRAGPTNNFPDEMYFFNFECQSTTQGLPLVGLTSCRIDTDIPGGRPTAYNKTFLIDGTGRGVFNITGSSRVISTYYNAWINAKNSSYSGNSNPSTVGYYDSYNLFLPNPSEGTICTDAEQGLSVTIHHSSNVITGNTGIDYFFRVTANTITNGTSFTDCDLECTSQINSRVSQVNNSSTGNTVFNGNYTLNSPFGKYFINPIPTAVITRRPFISSSASTSPSFFETYNWYSNTLPFSGSSTSPTLLPSLSGTVCNYTNTGFDFPAYNSNFKRNFKFIYQTRLTNPLNINDFDIWASPITNFIPSGHTATQYELAYRYSGGNVTFSSSTYIIG